MSLDKITYKNIYKNLIENKYKFSNENYQKEFEDESQNIFLFFFDMMNVYPLFPTIINIELNNNTNYSSSRDTKIELKQQLNTIVNQWTNIPKEELKKRARPMIRKFFSYEIIDHIRDNYNAEYVTTAWLKCYEIITNYSLLDNLDLAETTVNYFGICEQPGAFVYAINHYIKTKTLYKFDFIIESLVDKSNKKIFTAEKSLLNKYRNKYDYGADGTGDVTKIENIKFYRKKYIDKKFHIITADCGLDCSDDFAEQEKGLMNVVLGQFLLAISVCSKGSNYFYKQFTMYEQLTKEIMYLANQFFDQVYICRTLTTKPQSGEIYIICKNFKKSKKDMDGILKNLYDKYEKNMILDNIDDIDVNFINNIDEINNLLTMRRITSINFLYFRFVNSHYAKKNKKEIYSYIEKMVDYYKDYFIELYKIKKIEDSKKLL